MTNKRRVWGGGIQRRTAEMGARNRRGSVPKEFEQLDRRRPVRIATGTAIADDPGPCLQLVTLPSRQRQVIGLVGKPNIRRAGIDMGEKSRHPSAVG